SQCECGGDKQPNISASRVGLTGLLFKELPEFPDRLDTPVGPNRPRLELVRELPQLGHVVRLRAVEAFVALHHLAHLGIRFRGPLDPVADLAVLPRIEDERRYALTPTSLPELPHPLPIL